MGTQNYILRGIAMCLMMAMVFKAEAQQVPISNLQLSNPHSWNVALGGLDSNYVIAIGHRQWGGSNTNGWGRRLTYLNLLSPVTGRKGSIGYGLQVSDQRDHTEDRVAVSGSISTLLIRSKKFYWRAGAYFGLLTFYSNYNNTPRISLDDPLLTRSTTTEIDAGGATAFGLLLRWLQVRAAVQTAQLFRNAVFTQSLPARDLVPHVVGSGSALVSIPNANLWLGPFAFYRGTFLTDGRPLRRGLLDVGLKALLPKSGLWCALSYRSQSAALTGALGIRIAERPDIQSERPYWGIDASFATSFPMTQVNPFGPSVELGIGITLGKPKPLVLRQYEGPIWLNEANLASHKAKEIMPHAPDRLRSALDSSHNDVTLRYAFEDYSDEYGDDGRITPGGSLVSLGDEWQGMDSFTVALIHKVHAECLSPDPEKALNKNKLDSLSRLKSIELSISIVGDSFAYKFAGLQDRAVTYDGWLLPKMAAHDSLAVVVDGRDSTLVITKGKVLNNFDLAVLKLYAIQLKLRYELEQYHEGQGIRIVDDGETLPVAANSDADLPQYVIHIRKLRVLTNRPEQEAPFDIGIAMRYQRRGEAPRNRSEEEPMLPNGAFDGRSKPGPRPGKPSKPEKASDRFNH